MPNVLIRDWDDDVLEQLKAAARQTVVRCRRRFMTSYDEPNTRNLCSAPEYSCTMSTAQKQLEPKIRSADDI